MSRALIPLLLLATTLPGQSALEARVELAIKRGCRYLAKGQAAGGELGGNLYKVGENLEVRADVRVGAHALCMLALLHSGVAKDDPVILKALRPLRGAAYGTYDRAVRLMVLDMLREPALRAVANADAQALIRSQAGGGGWHYGNLRRGRDGFDNSNTQYAILGLRAADKLGIAIPRKTWRLALRHVLDQLHPDGGTGYAKGGASTPSMTAGAVSSLVVILARVDVGDRHGLRRQARHAIERGLDFLELHWRPLRGGHPYYAIYGLERAMAFADQARLGKRDWYREGAEVLVEAQKEDGSWNRNGVSTAFALLFLERATQTTAGETPGNLSRILGRLGVQSRPQDVRDATEAIVKRGRSVGTLLVHYLESPLTPVREAAFESLRRLYHKDLGYDPRRSPATNAKAIAAWRKLVRG